MLSDADRRKAADTLIDAAKTRKQATQLSVTFPGITFEDAYAISTEVAKRRIAAGEKLIGHKVGLTSKAMQASSQIDEPDYGYLFESMMVADGAKVPHENYCAPRVEIELAFVLGRDLKGPGVGLTDVLRATEYVVPAIEIVDARLVNPRKIFDTISDNGAAAGIVVGGRPVGPMDVDLRWVGGLMMRNSEIEETGVAAGVLGHPAMGVAWLANKLGSLGTPLEPAIWCSRARSRASSGRRRATPSARISARSAASRCSSLALRLGAADGIIARQHVLAALAESLRELALQQVFEARVEQVPDPGVAECRAVGRIEMIRIDAEQILQRGERMRDARHRDLRIDDQAVEQRTQSGRRRIEEMERIAVHADHIGRDGVERAARLQHAGELPGAHERVFHVLQHMQRRALRRTRRRETAGARRPQRCRSTGSAGSRS